MKEKHCLIQDVSHIPDEPYLFTGQSLLAVGDRRRAFGAFAGTGRKIRGHPVKTFPWLTSPSPHPCQKLPDTLQGTAYRQRGGTEKVSKLNVCFFTVSKGAVTKIYFHLKATE